MNIYNLLNIYAFVAQMVEHTVEARSVDVSKTSRGTHLNIGSYSSGLRGRPFKPLAYINMYGVGSSPILSTMGYWSSG